MGFKKFGNWSIFSKYLFFTAASFIPIFLILLFKIVPDSAERYHNDRQASLRQVIESAYGVMMFYDNKVHSGEMPLETAQKEAADQINKLRYSGNEYYFIYDMQGITRALGSAPEKCGDNRYNFTDSQGFKFVQEMIKVARNKGEGTVIYYYPKLGQKESLPKLSYVKLFEPWGWILGSGLYTDDLDNDVANLKMSIYIYMLVALLIASLLCLFAARIIARPVKALDAAARSITEGKIDTPIPVAGQDEVGNLALSLRKMVDDLKNSINESNRKKEEAEEATSKAREASLISDEQKEYLTKNTGVLLNEMGKFANGDLTVSVNPENKNDDIGKLFLGFNQAADNLKKIILQVSDAVQKTVNSSSLILSGSEELASGAHLQNTQTSEIASAVEQMTKTIFENTKSVSEAANISKRTVELTSKGTEKVEMTKKGIKEIFDATNKTGQIITSLAGKTDQIGEIAQVIDDIADQTNLLALNAAIEAARAGEQGRGFAVVADEVRKLAERTTKATKEIAGTILSIQNESKEADGSMSRASVSVKEGMQLAEEVSQVLQEINSGIHNVADTIDLVASSSEEQSASSEQISKNIEQISNIAQQSATNSTEITNSAEELVRLMNTLSELIEKFNLGQADRRLRSPQLAK
ncbi:MAG: methyl-accepting chemotaxis protein [Ignavibacteria bacterium]|jgi:methyl-accepting chemotaxis protein|nr:methyl-accepting chemotaxis protein [Ignavibacteria bacterium]MCU7504534.1 methyl-accepting chemotaxis protein [Ignavibacteria bacterium]MCU7516628.1 methyl-accepting chemotaxis protein [Ignavibacteria bacterium]